MARPVALLTDRSANLAMLGEALVASGLSLVSHAPGSLGDALASAAALLIDGRSAHFDEDELLTAVGAARAAGVVVGVVEVSSEVPEDTFDVLVELTSGLAFRELPDARRLARAVARRLDRGRERRFEYVTVGVREGELLVILGDGRAFHARRPVSEADDGSDVIDIALSDDAATAELSLASGGKAVIATADVVPTEIPSLNSVQSIAVDGAKLGKRLRALRLEAGLTQAELARRTGIHRPNIARVEAGRHTPSLETLARLASAIGVPTTRVLSDDV